MDGEVEKTQTNYGMKSIETMSNFPGKKGQYKLTNFQCNYRLILKDSKSELI